MAIKNGFSDMVCLDFGADGDVWFTDCFMTPTLCAMFIMLRCELFSIV